jgi:hypothetical protein
MDGRNANGENARKSGVMFPRLAGEFLNVTAKGYRVFI